MTYLSDWAAREVEILNSAALEGVWCNGDNATATQVQAPSGCHIAPCQREVDIGHPSAFTPIWEWRHVGGTAMNNHNKATH